MVILAHRLRDDDADDTTRFSCCSAFFVCSRGVYATVRRFFSNGSRATKTQTQVRKPQRAHTHVKILIPLPFQRTASTAIERQSDPKGTQSYLSSKFYLCQICMRCVYFVPAPRVATISKSICVESYSSL